MLKANEINISINTNAVLTFDEIIEFVLKNGISMFISFPCYEEKICDFITDKKGALNRILKSLDALKEKMLDFL